MFTNFFVKSISRKLKMISQSDYKSYTGCYEFKNGCHCCSLIPRQISSPKMTTNIYTLLKYVNLSTRHILSVFRSMKNSNSFFKEQFELHSTLIMRKKIVQFLVYKIPHIFHQLILGISMIFLFTLRPYHFIIIYSLCFLLLFQSWQSIAGGQRHFQASIFPGFMSSLSTNYLDDV